jgi:hypothetical protein
LGLFAVDLREILGVLVSVCPASVIEIIVVGLRLALTLPVTRLRVRLPVSLISAREGG